MRKCAKANRKRFGIAKGSWRSYALNDLPPPQVLLHFFV